MSTKKISVPERVRNFRTRAKLSQAELGDSLGVSGNYIYLIESGRKPPGPSLLKLFERMEQSPAYNSESSSTARGSRPAHGDSAQSNAFHALISTEQLLNNFSEFSEKLLSETGSNRKAIIGQLREMLDELESRELASSGPLSEAQRLAVKAASGRGAKRGA